MSNTEQEEVVAEKPVAEKPEEKKVEPKAEVCACGSKVSANPKNVARHIKTKKHLEFVAKMVEGTAPASTPVSPNDLKLKRAVPSKTHGLYCNHEVDDEKKLNVYTVVSDNGVVGSWSVPL